MKMWAQAQKDKADQQKMLMQQFSASEDSVAAARSYDTPNAQWITEILSGVLYGHGNVYSYCSYLKPTNSSTSRGNKWI